MKKIVLIDDHDTFRAGVRQLIEKFSDFEVAGEGADARQGEEAVRTIKPDIAVIDLSLPDKSGIQLTRILKGAVPETRIIIVSMHSKIDYILGALRAGAIGYIVKESVSDCLHNALEAALQDEYYLDSALSREIAIRLLEAAESSDLSDSTYGNLTAREQEIFRLLAQGVAVADIADKLCISAKTVTNHRANILSKLDLHSTVDLVRYAAKLGLLEDIS
ncbi:DNA-binding response regulator, NarL/FixJ family [Candidatus Electrothrix aarhusensis]|jgi:DNA-binding NarL/FixJ family response regulator|uniref:DNA-binding response regulator, NarL/FixJ family n=1 Tax=Candidatus Electrothrix aarhusensis TaxID=1859131 RepID=A0A3S3U8J7_9BACT|nr:DNA-binding response regulator, NarL/FixJ family [Candidatus Electrothrix aarhusensis]